MCPSSRRHPQPTGRLQRGRQPWQRRRRTRAARDRLVTDACHVRERLCVGHCQDGPHAGMPRRDQLDHAGTAQATRTAALLHRWRSERLGGRQRRDSAVEELHHDGPFAANHHTVVINDFGVRVVKRAKPTGGTRATLSAGCGGLEPSLFTANLDANNPVAQPVAGRDASGKVVPPVPLPHEITDSGPEVWRLQLTTAHCQCDYIPYFDWSSEGSSGRYDVTLRNKPWRITASTGAKSAYPSGKSWTAF
jgi:hypothetical protein